MARKELYRVWWCKEALSNNGEWHIQSGTTDVMAVDEAEACKKITDKGWSVTGVKECWG